MQSNETQVVMQPAAQPPPPFLRSWLPMFLLSGVFIHALSLCSFPAASLLGAMFAAIVMSVYVGGMKMPSFVFWIGQGIIGIVIGLRMPRGFWRELARSWPMFMGGVVWAIVAAALIGMVMTKWRVFPGTTAIWGLSPGAAGTMTIMSEDYGGDMRLTAFMQYLRVVCVVLVTSVVTRLWVGKIERPQQTDWLVAPDWPRFGMTLLMIGVALGIARVFRVPAGTILVPIIVGMLCNYLEIARLDSPPWFMACGSTLLGWTIGLRFNRDIVRQAARSFWRVLAAILLLIAMCGAYAAGMAIFAGVDPLTAYLAASPGGMDSVAIIAASANVDISFVMAMQTARFILVVLSGPFLARYIVRKTGLVKGGALPKDGEKQ